MARRGNAPRSGDAAGPVKEGTLGESNLRLSARLQDKADQQAERKGLGFMLARLQEEADAQFAFETRKGVCRKCRQVRSQNRKCECDEQGYRPPRNWSDN